MTIWVRVQQGEVVETWPEGPVLHPSLMTSVHQAPDDVQAGWLCDGTTFSPPPPPVYPPEVLLARVDQLRDAALAAVEWNGKPVPTRGEPLLLLIGRAAAYAAGIRTTDSTWLMGDGELVTLTSSQFMAMAAAVDQGIDAVYTRSFVLKAAIATGTVNTLDDVNAAWTAG